MFAAVCTLLFLIGFAASQSLDDCPPGVPRDQYLTRYRNLCLEFVLYREKDFFSAEKDCEIRGGKLVMVKDVEISNFIIDKMVFDYQFNDRVWIGLTDNENEGYWKWVDGTPLDMNGYTHFAADNQDNMLEDCAAIDPSRNGEWHDYHCENEFFGLLTYEFPYICQYNAKASTSVSTSQPMLTTTAAKVPTSVMEGTVAPSTTTQQATSTTTAAK